VLAAEEPTSMRGGLRLGGKQGLRDTFVGETTRYVVQKAPVRVILTAPASTPDGRSDPTAPREEVAPVPHGTPRVVTAEPDAR
jgi:APA family basic amino acid/polyamine antiporter